MELSRKTLPPSLLSARQFPERNWMAVCLCVIVGAGCGHVSSFWDLCPFCWVKLGSGSR